MTSATRLSIIVSLILITHASRLFAQDASRGKASYRDVGCQTCHGADGEGGASGPSLVKGTLPLAAFVAYVRKPAGTMQPYSGEDLSDRDLADIYAYLEPKGSDRATEGRVAAGATLYRKTGCYECHSNEAQGGAQGPRLGPDPISFARFSWYVRYPTGAMPPYTAKVLSDEDLADIYAFVAARPEPPPLTEIPLLVPKD
jgi:mono/diheme cytochrome c family protein